MSDESQRSKPSIRMRSHKPNRNSKLSWRRLLTGGLMTGLSIFLGYLGSAWLKQNENQTTSISEMADRMPSSNKLRASARSEATTSPQQSDESREFEKFQEWLKNRSNMGANNQADTDSESAKELAAIIQKLATAPFLRWKVERQESLYERGISHLTNLERARRCLEGSIDACFNNAISAPTANVRLVYEKAGCTAGDFVGCHSSLRTIFEQHLDRDPEQRRFVELTMDLCKGGREDLCGLLNTSIWLAVKDLEPTSIERRNAANDLLQLCSPDTPSFGSSCSHALEFSNNDPMVAQQVIERLESACESGASTPSECSGAAGALKKTNPELAQLFYEKSCDAGYGRACWQLINMDTNNKLPSELYGLIKKTCVDQTEKQFEYCTFIATQPSFSPGNWSQMLSMNSSFGRNCQWTENQKEFKCESHYTFAELLAEPQH